MSFAKRDRKVRSGFGTTFPSNTFAQEIALALRREYGSTTAAIKTVVGLVGGNERAIKNWFEAKNAPNGESVVALCRHSDQVLITVLRMAGRTTQARAQLMEGIADKLIELLTLLKEAREPEIGFTDE